MRHIKKLAAVTVLAAMTALMPIQSAEARGGRALGLGIAGAIIGSALIASAYGHQRYYGHRHYYAPRHYGYPRYVYGSSYYYPRRHYYRQYYYRPHYRHYGHWRRW